MLKPGGRFFTYHLGSNSSSFREANAKLLDQYTVERVNNPKVPLHSNLSTCFIDESLLRSMLEEAGLANVELAKTTRTYTTGKVIEYLAASAQKV